MAERMKMFHWTRVDLSTQNEPPPKYTKKADLEALNRQSLAWRGKLRD